MMLRGFLLIIFCFLLLSVSAQNDIPKVPKSSKKLYAKAVNAFENKDYFLAKFYFQELENRGEMTPDQKLIFGKYLYDIGEYDMSYNLFSQIEKTDPKDPIKYYYLSILDLQKKDYKKSKDYALFFLKQSDVRTNYKEEYKHLSQVKLYLDTAIAEKDKTINKTAYVYTVQKQINTPAAEFNPIQTKNGLIYGSQDMDKINYFSNKKIKKSELPPLRQIYTAEGSQYQFSNIKPFDLFFDSFEVSGFCFDEKWRVMYLSGCIYDEDSMRYECQIYISKLVDKQWTKPEIIPELYKKGYSNTHVSLGVDPESKATVLFFSSNRKPSQGGYDIWMAVQNSRSQKFFLPRNLGYLVNSPLDDITPFFHNATNTLYFSSKGKAGLGGFDVYASQWNKNVFSKTTPLDEEINSPYDDVFFTASPTFKEGYLVSNRYSENSMINPHCCDDIFYWTKNKLIIDTSKKIDTTKPIIATKTTSQTKSTNCLNDGNPHLKLQARDNQTGKIIPEFEYTLWKIDKENQSFFIDKDIAKNEVRIDEVETSLYQVEIYAKTYYQKKKYIDIKKDSCYELIVDLEKINYNPIILPLVEFDFDEYTLTSKAKTTLNEMVVPVLKNNPKLMVELSAHTDSRGTTEYNEELSTNRARAIYTYLVENQDIDPRRLKYKGYGEYVPIAPNEFPDGTDNEDGRQRNRRCEFKILKTEFDPY